LNSSISGSFGHGLFFANHISGSGIIGTKGFSIRDEQEVVKIVSYTVNVKPKSRFGYIKYGEDSPIACPQRRYDIRQQGGLSYIGFVRFKKCLTTGRARH
jgi:hypothetical protein